MPFKSEKQRKWMHANNPEMAKKWEKEEKMKKETKVRQLIKKMVREVMSEINETKARNYKEEYKKYGSSKKAKKYRAELNAYNRKKGTYGNGDGKDASHKGGKIAGFEKESVNRGRAEKSRLKKEGNIGITTKKGKSIYLTHKTSGKEIVVQNTPSILKKYKRLGYLISMPERKLTEVKETIFDVAARVVKNHQAEKWKGSLMDATSANLLVKVFKEINPKMKQILSKLGDKDPKQLMATLWAVVKWLN